MSDYSCIRCGLDLARVPSDSVTPAYVCGACQLRYMIQPTGPVLVVMVLSEANIRNVDIRASVVQRAIPKWEWHLRILCRRISEWWNSLF